MVQTNKPTARGKKDKPLPRTKVKRSNVRYILDNPFVISYAQWHATPYTLRDDDNKSESQFLKNNGYSTSSRYVLGLIGQMPGFWELRQEKAKQFLKHYLSIADEGLLKRASGMTRTKQALTADGYVKTLEEEIIPETAACRTIHEVYGGFKTAEEKAADTLAAAMTKACMQQQVHK